MCEPIFNLLHHVWAWVHVRLGQQIMRGDRGGGVGLKNGPEMGRVGGRNLCCKALCEA